MLHPLARTVVEDTPAGSWEAAQETAPGEDSLAWMDADGCVEAAHWVANVDARIVRLRHQESSLPMLLDGPHAAYNSYVAGARAAWLDYAAHEALRSASPTRQRLLKGLAIAPLALARAAFAAAGFTRAAWLDNPLFSTQLGSPVLASNVAHWRALALQQATDRLLFWRNVCADVEPVLPSALRADGWRLLPARLVYLCDPSSSDLWKRNHVRRDHKLMRSDGLDWVSHAQLTVEDIPALRRCFRAVFFDKHSALNPDFTDAFFARCLQPDSPLELLALRWQGQLVGVLALYIQHGWLTTPLIGYDTTAPGPLGLYRRLMARLLWEAKDRGLRLHYSSGAGDFKRHRGGEPVLEFTAVHSGALSGPKRWMFEQIADQITQHAPALLMRNG